jgi:hypothetical protein
VLLLSPRSCVLMLVLLIGCKAVECPAGSVLEDDGLCYLPDPSDSGPSDSDPSDSDPSDSDPSDSSEPTVSEGPPDGVFETVTVGGYHTCVIASDGTLTCWGYSGDGQLDAPGGAFTAISAGLVHTCALATEGTLACWGNDDHGQSSPPTGTYTAVSAGLTHTCALATDGTLACWGNNDKGQTDAPEGAFTAITAGGSVSSAISTQGVLTCWGHQNYCIPEALSGTTMTAAGFQHHIAVTDEGVACGGFSGDGRCPDADTALIAISAGSYQSCGLVGGGALQCWPSENNVGEQTWPTGDFSMVASGHRSSCAITAEGTVLCWESDGTPIE